MQDALTRVSRSSLPQLKKTMGGAASFFWGRSNDKTDIMDSPEAKFIQSKIKDNCIVVFSKTTCGYCRMAKDTLNETGATYEVIELNHEAKAMEYAEVLREMTGAATVPRVFINGKCIGGGSETRDLHREGKLVSLIQECGISVSTPPSKM
ncbi:uncharacterized protein LOC135492292 isoform X2 [Lineus longissimus]|uniref:uncharacterized protein LOC135492292 isoform X2 n=1 Tax=Lineus longissimus TaxID=88925 RepID=UPI00315D3E31